VELWRSLPFPFRHHPVADALSNQARAAGWQDPGRDRLKAGFSACTPGRSVRCRTNEKGPGLRVLFRCCAELCAPVAGIRCRPSTPETAYLTGQAVLPYLHQE
jgi:hypothetical protein